MFFPKPLKTVRSDFTPPTTFDATLNAAMDAAIVPIAFPRASMVAGSAPFRASKIPTHASITVCAIGPMVEEKPSNSPLKKAPRLGNSCSIPVIRP